MRKKQKKKKKKKNEKKNLKQKFETKKQSNISQKREEGESLLSLACSAGYYELVQVKMTQIN